MPSHLLSSSGLRTEDIDPNALTPAQKDTDNSLASDADSFDARGRQMRGGLGGATSSGILPTHSNGKAAARPGLAGGSSPSQHSHLVHLLRNTFDFVEQKGIQCAFINLDQAETFDRASAQY